MIEFQGPAEIDCRRCGGPLPQGRRNGVPPIRQHYCSAPCRLCGAPIDRELTFPHPGSATIDHRDPDGPHDSSNWQSAHLACNTSKGRKVAIGADPALRLAAAS